MNLKKNRTLGCVQDRIRIFLLHSKDEYLSNLFLNKTLVNVMINSLNVSFISFFFSNQSNFKAIVYMSMVLYGLNVSLYGSFTLLLFVILESYKLRYTISFST